MRYLTSITLMLLGFVVGHLTSLPPVVKAQDQPVATPIRIDSVNLTLGMPEAQVVARFGSGYRLDPFGESGKLVLKQPPAVGMNYDMIATLSFSNGRLSHVSKSWVSDQQSIESFWNGLFGSISSVAGPQGSRALVVVKELSQPNSNSRRIILTWDDRSIQISRVERYQNPKLTAFGVDESFPPIPQSN